MGVYSCWYREIFGYACRVESGSWIFVPEMGQADQNVYKNLQFDELIFNNIDEQRGAMNAAAPDSMVDRIKNMLFPGFKPKSVAGRLLLRE